MKKLLSITLTLAMMLSLLTMPVSAIGMRGQDPPTAEYTSLAPTKGTAGCILYEDFDSCDSAQAAGFYPTTQEKETNGTYYESPDCEIALSSEQAHSGTKSLKVYHRDLVDDSTKGHHTFIYKGTNEFNTLGALIKGHYSSSAPHTDTYFFRAWVYSDTPQTFMFSVQYGGSLEFWTPNEKYYDVPAKTWTLIGGRVQDGVTYYSSMLEDYGGCGFYPPRPTTTWSGLKATTYNEDQVNTWGDFYVDDIALWKVEDSRCLFNYNERTQQIEDLSGNRPGAKLGDADGDDDVTMKDVLEIRKFIAGLPGVSINGTAADVNRDGSVDMKDVLLTRKYIAGVISSYDKPQPPDAPQSPFSSLVLVADDQYATIWYSGCEKENASETNVYFVVQNKTNYQLIVEVDSLAVNGWTLTDVFVFEPVAPNSKANIKVSTEQLNSLDVTSISGVFALWDTTYKLWNDSTREYIINKAIS